MISSGCAIDAPDRVTSARGFALITVVLFMIGLAVLASGLAYAAAQQATVTGSLRDLVRARHAAEAALEHALYEWSAARRSLDPAGVPVPVLAGVHLEPDVWVAAEARRLSGSAWLLSGSARVGRGALTPIEHRSTRLVRSVDADSVGAALDAALIADAVRVDAGAVVSGASEVVAHDAEAIALCERWTAVGAALRAPPESVSVSGGAIVTGIPVLVVEANAGRFRSRLDFLDLADLRGLSVALADSVVTPAPVTVGAACDTAATGNWGAPDGACADRHVLVHATGPLTLDGGYGQGVLIVDGDVVLDGGVRFRGILIASGSVVIRNGSIEGSVAADRVIVEVGGRAALDRCAIAAALVRTPPLRRPHLPSRSWLPSFD